MTLAWGEQQVTFSRRRPREFIPQYGPNGLPAVTTPIVVEGNGATIERSQTAPFLRFFYVSDTGDLTLRRLTLANGYVKGGDGGYGGGGGGGAGLGGAIFNRGALRLENSTLTGNIARGGNGGLWNVTLYPNVDAGGGGGGLGGNGGFGGGGNAPAQQRAAGEQRAGRDICCVTDEINAGTVDVSATSNLIEEDNCVTFSPGPDPLVGPLADNGGSTRTHALLAGSSAIDGGDPAFVGPPAYDQRGPGYVRVSGGRIDIGAFEYQVSDPDPDGDGTPTADEDTNGDGDPTNDDSDGDGTPDYLDPNYRYYLPLVIRYFPESQPVPPVD